MTLSRLQEPCAVKHFIACRATADKIHCTDLYHSPNAVNHPHVGAPQREVYFIGLIDVLTQYDTKKKAAHAAKAVKHGVRDQLYLKGTG